ncbi:Sec34-domain-containing protein [Gonapodya prolifera JEL478]|uniref:Conserved oligomeric Golgi complex subunit 3 n=1 Tax=Gonapodya prolifera (strain JEL478) TaxID=1344416 RepID=A0A139A9X4_GONPJ|nr:Sec34-domain-containing protein [Gonapodya prolifera JEL478]|eukprot:KXS13586.1 Sec34-domain-containing protein [Gonapodya prolifera JEL478]
MSTLSGSSDTATAFGHGLPSPVSKRSIAERWESFTDLRAHMKESIADIQASCAELPLPEKFTTPTAIDNHLDTKPHLPRRLSSGEILVTSAGQLQPHEYVTRPRPSMVDDGLAQNSSKLSSAKMQYADVDANMIPEKAQGNPTLNSSITPIENTQQFLSWFSAIEDEMEKEQDDVYRSHLATLNLYLSACDNILWSLEHTSSLLSQLSTNYSSVQSKTRALQEACERLLEEQTELSEVEREIVDRLRFFDDLETISRQLSMSGDIFSRFLAMLERLDECLEFMEAHANYLEADLYRLRFRQCLTRSMSMIKLQFLSEIQKLVSSDGARLGTTVASSRPTSDIQGPSEDLHIYLKFRASAMRLRPLIQELERRVPSNKEYLSLLRECYATYFSVRLAQITTKLQGATRDMAKVGLLKTEPSSIGSGFEAPQKPSVATGPSACDLVGMAKTGFAYVSHICSEEYSLFRQFFSAGSTELSNFLDSLIAPVCDSLRSLIIHETRIDHLSELSLLLSSIASSSSAGLLVDANADKNIDGTEIVDDDDEAGGGAVREAAIKVLEDTQARLSFRAQEYIRKEIERYEPREADLEVFLKSRKFGNSKALSFLPPYTTSSSSFDATSAKEAATIAVEEEISSPKPLNQVAAVEESESEDQLARRSSLSIANSNWSGLGGKTIVYGGGELYPTVQRTLYVLRRLYRALKPAVFEDIAQEAVDLCRKSLVLASEILARKSRQEAQLFLIKNILTLREETVTFDASFVRREDYVDLPSVRDALLLLLDPNTFISFGANIKVVESYADARQNLDQELKRVSEAFVVETSTACVDPLQSFLAKVSAFKLGANSSASSGTVKDQIYAQPTHVQQAYDSFREALSVRLVGSVQRLDEMIGDKKTEAVIVRVIKNSILDSYRNFYAIVKSEYGAEPKVLERLATPSEMEENIVRLTGGIDGAGLTNSFVGEV